MWWKTLYSCGFPVFSIFKVFLFCGAAQAVACAPR